MLAAFSLTLPHTPPKPVETGANRFAWLEAMRLLRTPFILGAVAGDVRRCDRAQPVLQLDRDDFWAREVAGGGVGIPGNWIMPVMSIGQIAEILTMLVSGGRP